ncbi:IS3 family transposase [Mycolicibacterium smegmatis]|uniref:IS3 family transposase n=1 Tax=Mycolicibacterium smegmatis TaxID=1772 RepID=UPI000A2F00FF|nr:IS3 family transposase [Mycolicibacterium smegmatis]MBE9616147.1 IS3 family transposase [Mycolicibacterium smegmatis]MBE9622477.1 IS3 family transposase [Mycolicibacterium smegmatis]MBE9628978.1 IS3 family transposase [Mycolicibacterium smegmatis]MBE9641105.1 IS3 family transposase [Mycolicibacterium smegmatis]MBE9647604.1 IS3 family transposase [Mycolicibacterium smegmatis]
MARPYPREFRDDVVRVARNRDDGVTIEQIATDFGVHPMTLHKWMRQADIDEGAKPGKSTGESAELREARRRIKLLEQENEVLRRATAYLSQANLPKRLYPLVSELAADGIPVAVTCRVLKLARQPYYRWRANPITDAEIIEAYRANALFDAHRDDPEFGYRYLVEEARDAGETMAERTAWRICSQNRLWSVFGKKRGKNGKVGPPVHDDLVERDFTAGGPNQLWLSDITEHRTDEGKLYLCAIKDVFSNRIVGYSIDARMKSRLATTALSSAVARRGDVAGCILHSDRGSQFRSRRFVRVLGRHEMVGSMGRVGAAGDNAAMESFFALLQKNVLDRRRWRTREELRIAIVTWIERTYHRRRRQAGLGRLTPIEFEAIMTTPASQAA